MIIYEMCLYVDNYMVRLCWYMNAEMEFKKPEN